MKIIISNYDDISNPYYGGGGAIAIHEVAKRLAKEHEIIVLTGNYLGAVEKTLNSVHYKRVGLSKAGPKLGQILFQLCLPSLARRMNYDIWIESFTPPFSTAFLPLFTKKPVVGLTHLLSGKEKSKEYKLPFYLIENLGLKTYKYFIVLTNDLKKKVSRINETANIEIIPNGVNVKGFKYQEKTEKYILYLGRIEIYQKGLDILLNAYKRVVNELDFKLLIAGSGSKKDEEIISKLIKEGGLEQKVSYIGKIGGKQKLDVINKSMFMVMPSRYENYPLVLLEALSMGKPTLLFNTEGVKWLPEEYCLKVKPFSENEFAKGMIMLAKKSSLRESISAGARNYAKNFDWEIIAEKYSSYIEKIALAKGGKNENTNHSRVFSTE